MAPDERDGVGSRHEARERAMGLLYEAEAKELEPAELLGEQAVEPPEFACDLVRGVGRHRAQLDELIDRFSRNWRIDRMPAVDRTVLRLACFELAHRPDVPTAVVIDEAVELARTYSTDESPRFVNGLLDRIATEVRGAPSVADGGP